MGNNISIALKGVSKTYPPSVKALQSVDLAVREGSLVGVLGPNGSGKSTMVKMLAGLIRTFQGEACIEGFRLPSRGCARLLGYMPQQTALYMELTVSENLDFFGAINGIRSGARRRERTDELLSILSLEEKRGTPAEHLSGGMRQRLSLGCALMHEPRILLLDEPTVGLDPGLRLSFWQYFKKLAESGSTILICTHAFDEAKHCSHLAFLKSGRLIRFGTRDEVGAASEGGDWEAAYMAGVSG